MRLSHERLREGGTEPRRWLLFLHGIYGAGRNWSSVARRVVRARPDWGAVLVDLRQHGGSHGFSPPHTVEAAAEDVRELVRHLALAETAVLGHSFGGKVALLYAREPSRPLAQLWVVDSTPDARAPAGSAWEMLETLRSLPSSFGERGDAVDALVSHGLADGVAQWMATNLVRADGGGDLRWKISADDMEALLLSFFDTDVWDVVESPPSGLDLHVVQAEASNVLDRAACARVEAAGSRTGQVQLHRIAGGHWVNAENPDALVALLTEELPRG